MEKPFVLDFSSSGEGKGITANKKWNAVNGGSEMPGGTLLFGEDTVVFGIDEVEF